MPIAELETALIAVRDELDRIKPASDQLSQAKDSVSKLANILADQSKSYSALTDSLGDFVSALKESDIPDQLKGLQSGAASITEGVQTQTKRGRLYFIVTIVLLVLLSGGTLGLIAYSMRNPIAHQAPPMPTESTKTEVFSLMLDGGRAFGPFKLERGESIQIAKSEFRLEKIGDGYEIRSASSGKRYGPLTLTTGDRLEIGNMVFEVQR
jgi:hypothetical protein